MYDFRMSVELNPKVGVGIVPSGGMRNWISFSGGSWMATWGSGTVLVSLSSLFIPDMYIYYTICGDRKTQKEREKEREKEDRSGILLVNHAEYQ